MTQFHISAMRQRVTRALACTVVLTFFLTGQAFAHAALVASDPADGAVLAKVPTELSLTFDEPVSPLILKLIEPNGNGVSLGKPKLDGKRIVLDAPSSLGTGSYVLSWRVISEDGHPVGGAVIFSIGMPSSGATAEATEAIDWPLRIAIWLCRVLVYIGLFVGAGGAFFLFWFAGGAQAAHRFITGVSIAGLVATGLSLCLLGADALDLGLFSLAEPKVWATALSTSYALTAFFASVSMLAALWALYSRAPREARAASALAMVGVGLALASSGHAAAANPQWLMRPAVFVHATAVAFWVGALAPLAALFVGKDEATGPALRRFSVIIPYVLAALLAAGIALAIVQVGHFPALVSTAYGRVLVAKLALVALLLALAAFNRWRLTKPALAGDARAERRFIRSVAGEIVLVTAILCTVALWRFTPPPRALADAAPVPPVSVHIHAERAMASITVSPGRAGPVSVSAFVVGGDLEPLDAKEVTLSFSMPSAGIEPIRREAHKLDQGQWRVDGLRLPVAGRWNVSVDILISDFESVTLKSEITLR
ncbi:copper resistance CopC/CopD family protein [Mesorhizobium koreense]|jgi:copper transport protein|uniref:copper resistance CopC/CopD family protein n=1 Tax=Mesorhizobium koreense TaxID=3074855 RepID=UPI00287B7BDE|nr:copper resistance CopC/CopD family protein [Mesorhizobium sp. WR6]